MAAAPVLPSSPAPTPETAAQRGIGAGFGRGGPEAGEFRLVAQFPVGELQLAVQARAAVGVGKLMQLAQPRSAPLEGVAEIARAANADGVLRGLAFQ